MYISILRETRTQGIGVKKKILENLKNLFLNLLEKDIFAKTYKKLGKQVDENLVSM